MVGLIDKICALVLRVFDVEGVSVKFVREGEMVVERLVLNDVDGKSDEMKYWEFCEIN